MRNKRSTDQIGRRLSDITSDLRRYVEKRIELVMLRSGEYFSKWVAMAVYRSAGAMIVLAGIGFLLIALAIYIGELLDSRSLGYVIVSIPLLVTGGLFMYLKPRSLFEELKSRFEVELIEAVEHNLNKEKKRLESPDMRQPLNKED
ncbi:MAG TPA: phage holin family protein [Fodinibius sp.]|nr:phage holin family protein [Fodinibius sp.]